MAVAKKATKKVAAKRKNDGVYWVVSVRNKLFGWKPFQVFKTYEKASDRAKELESTSVLGVKYAKVDRVQLVG